MLWPKFEELQEESYTRFVVADINFQKESQSEKLSFIIGESVWPSQFLILVHRYPSSEGGFY